MTKITTRDTTYRDAPTMRYLVAIILTQALLVGCFLLSGCSGGGKEDDTASTSSTTTTVNDADSCPIDFEAATAEEAVAQAEDAFEAEAVAVEEIPQLDQGGALRVFRVYLKDINVNITGCGNHVSVEDNDSPRDDHSTVDIGGQDA